METEKRVLALVAQESGQNPQSLTPDTTLAEDLGIQGDDAIGFFEVFRTEFAADLSDLQRDWRLYFGREEKSLWAGIVMGLVAMAGCAALTYFEPKVPWYVWGGLTFAGWLAALAVWARRRSAVRSPQITIQDLVDTARAGRWTKSGLQVIPGTVAGRENQRTAELRSE